MDLLNALLDLADAISAAVALVGFWYTWVLPADPRTLPAADERERAGRAGAVPARGNPEQTVRSGDRLRAAHRAWARASSGNHVSRARAQMG